MESIPKFVGVLSCDFVLCLGLSTVESSSGQLNTGQSDGKLWTVDDTDRFVASKAVKGCAQVSEDTAC